MKKSSFFSWLKDVSISKKLYFIVGAMAFLIVIELITLWFAIHTLSSVRALIGAEGLWSKAQKDALYHLGKYNRAHDETDYTAFKKFMAVPLGDHKTRMELFKQKPDMTIARQGFIEGRVHPDDIDGMIKLLRNFNQIDYINKAIVYWSAGDSVISRLMPIGEALHKEIQSPSFSQEKANEIIKELDPINEQLTALEDNFSYTLEEGSRWLENLILKVVFSVALTVEITGLILTIMVSSGISKGLREINRATNELAKGNLTARATVFSKDEIGQVAIAVNQMTEQLILSNQELGHFAYIASHDLQEPLRKMSVFTNLLEEESKNTISEKGKTYMEKIIKSSVRMQRLIDDILQFSRLNTDIAFNTVDLNKVIAQVLSDLEYVITDSNAIIHLADLPSIEGNSIQLGQLFQNLISNALKFNTAQPDIEIYAEIINGNQLPDSYWANSSYKYKLPKKIKEADKEKFCRIYVKDNGIGFQEEYLERMFIIFQRLNSKHMYEGTGIGLAVCRKITDIHNGIITAASIIDQGSVFIVTLPLEQKNFIKEIKA